MPKRYEHTIRSLDNSWSLLSVIEGMEEDGWELCTTDRLPQSHTVRLLFKRPVPPTLGHPDPADHPDPRNGVEL